VNWLDALQHWLAVHTGTVNEPGGYYGFFSGFGSDLGEIALIGALWAAWHRVNCHTKGCLRIGRQRVEGTTYVVCRKCHPDGKPTRAHILAAHRAHKERLAAGSGKDGTDGSQRSGQGL
jgi:hypothetical protein